MNILCGITSIDRGGFSLSGVFIKNGDPKDSSKAGIGMVRQHPEGSGPLTVTENIILGFENRKFGIFTDYKKANQKIELIQNKYKLPLDKTLTGNSLNSPQIQRMELLYLLYNDKKVIIFDEPTASLSDIQIDELIKTIRTLKDEGRIILFISHKLKEVFKIADKVAVIRKGKLVLHDDIKNVTPEQIAREMMGKSLQIDYPERKRYKLKEKRKILYSIKDLYYKRSGSNYLEGINLNIRTGEIIGIAGIRENGLELLEDIISGMYHPDRGILELNGHDVTNDKPAQLRSKGISYVPADRLKRGVSTDSTIAENLILLNYKRMHKMGILAPASVNMWAKKVQAIYKIDGKPQQQIKYLSGGNIQKVILTRELQENPELIIICEPSWGLDFSSRNNLHKKLHKTVKSGTSILLISSDIDEILALSDRIIVLYNGKVAANKYREELDRQKIGEYMLGIRGDSEKLK